MRFAGYDFIGRRQVNLCFHLAGSGENLLNITKSCDASIFARNSDEA